MVRYIRSVYEELMNKVSWPTTKELQSSALVVMIASFIIAMLILGMDKSFQFVTTQIVY